MFGIISIVLAEKYLLDKKFQQMFPFLKKSLRTFSQFGKNKTRLSHNIGAQKMT
jgi:hypothetical protein